MKKLFALLLIVSMLATMLVACNNDGEQSEAPSTPSHGTDVSDTSTEVSVPVEEEKCWLPEKDWNTTILWATVASVDNETDVRNFEIWCEEDIGDTLSKRFVERSNWLRDTYGITIDVIFNPTGRPDGYAKLAVETDLDLDVISMGITYIAQALVTGYFYDIRTINTQYNDGNGWLSLDKAYWDQGVINDLSIANKVFMITGDAILNDDETTWAMFFNKDMIKDYHFESPYTTVKNGNWTLDTLYEYCKKVTKPAGEKPVWQPDADDTYGLVVQSADTLFFMLGCDQAMIEKDSDDLPTMRFTNERYIDVCQRFVSFFSDDNAVGRSERFGSWDSDVTERQGGIFANGHAMFMPNSLTILNSPRIKSSSVDIGVIPMPKADDLQDDYAASGNMYGNEVIAIPISNVDHLEATLFALEAMAWYGEKYIKSEYYEKVLKLQKFRDEEAEEMLDLIFSKKKYEMGCIYNWGDMVQFYNQLVGSKSTDVISKYEQNRDKYQADIDAAIDTFTSLDFQ